MCGAVAPKCGLYGRRGRRREDCDRKVLDFMFHLAPGIRVVHFVASSMEAPPDVTEPRTSRRKWEGPPATRTVPDNAVTDYRPRGDRRLERCHLLPGDRRFIYMGQCRSESPRWSSSRSSRVHARRNARLGAFIDHHSHRPRYQAQRKEKRGEK